MFEERRIIFNKSNNFLWINSYFNDYNGVKKYSYDQTSDNYNFLDKFSIPTYYIKN